MALMGIMETNILAAAEYDLWNTFVDDSPQGDVFCYSWWLKTVTKDDFKIIVVRDNNQIVAGIILPFYSTGRINEPYLTRTIGVLYNKPGNELPRKRLSMERKWLNALLDRVDINHVVQFCMHHNFRDWLPFRWRGYRQTTRYTYILEYGTTTIEEIWKNISRRQKRLILKAAQNGITVEEGDDITTVYKYSCLSFDRQNKKFPYSLADLKNLDDTVKEHGMRKIFQVVDGQHKVLAADYVVYHEKSAYHLLSGGDVQFRALGGHTLLLWHVISYFSDKVPIFNFGGSDIEAIEEHIRSFGGIQKQYFHIFNETLASNRGGLRYQGAQLFYHGREVLKDLWNRPLKEHPIIFYKLLKYLSYKVMNVLGRRTNTEAKQ